MYSFNISVLSKQCFIQPEKFCNRQTKNGFLQCLFEEGLPLNVFSFYLDLI